MAIKLSASLLEPLRGAPHMVEEVPGSAAEANEEANHHCYLVDWEGGREKGY